MLKSAKRELPDPTVVARQARLIEADIRAASSVRDFCRRWSISRSYFYALRAEGRIRTVKLGRKKSVILAADEAAFTATLSAS